MQEDEEDGRVDDDQVDEQDSEPDDGDHVNHQPGDKVISDTDFWYLCQQHDYKCLPVILRGSVDEENITAKQDNEPQNEASHVPAIARHIFIDGLVK